MGLPILQTRPTIASAMGQGALEGANLSLNQRIQEQQEQKKLQMQSEYYDKLNKKLFPGEDWGSAPPEYIMKLKKMQYEQGTEQQGAQSLLNMLGLNQPSNQPMNAPPGQEYLPQPQTGTEPSRTTLADRLRPGQHMMLPQEEMPAEGQETRQISRPTQPMPRQPTEQPKTSTYAQQKADLKAKTEKELAKTKSPKLRKEIAKAYQQEVGNIARVETASAKTRGQEYKETQDIIKKNEDISSPYLKNLFDQERKAVTLEESNSIARSAAESGNTSGIWNFLIDKHGWTPGRTPDAALLTLASKEFIFSTVGRLSGQKNKWIEQQAKSMYPSAGDKKSSAFGILDFEDFQVDVTKKEAEIARNLSDKYRKTIGYVPSEIQEQVQKDILPYIKQKAQYLALKIQEDKEIDLSDEQIARDKKINKGAPLTPRRRDVWIKEYGKEEAIKLAKNRGYTIPPKAQSLQGAE